MLETNDRVLVNQVELDWYADNDIVTVRPRNQMRFDIQKDRAIEILQRANEAELWRRQFGFLLNRLAVWLRSQPNKFSNAIITLSDNSLAFVVVQFEAAYDEGFQDALADLEFDIANDPDLELVKLKTLALPNVTGEALHSFLDSRLVVSYHGERTGPHPTGEPQS